MKLKHQFLILCALVASTFCFIASAHAFEGFYAGGSFGGILSPVNHLGDKFTDIIVTGGSMKINDEWHTARKPSMNFTVNAGFGRLFDKQYSGIQVGINKSRYRLKISKTTETWELRTNEALNLTLRDVDYTVDYKHGYLLSKNTMVFVKTGISRTRARLSLQSESLVKYNNNMSYSHPVFLKKEKTIHPVRIGFGIEHKLTDRIAATVDYTYSRYIGSFKLKGQTKANSAVGTVSARHNHKLTIQDTSIMMGVKTYF